MSDQTTMSVEDTAVRMEQLAASALADSPLRTIALHFQDAARHLRRQTSEIEMLRALVTDLADPDRCLFDHHGYCQAHGWMVVNPPCPHGRAQEMGLASDD